MNTEYNIQPLLMRYIKHWTWFVLSFSIMFLLAYMLIKYLTPAYKIQASILIKDEKKGVTDQTIMKEFDTFTESKVVENEVEILKSYALMDRVVKSLGLNVQYYKELEGDEIQIYKESPIRLVIEKPTEIIYGKKLKVTFVDERSLELNGNLYKVNESVKTPFGQLRFLVVKPIDMHLNPLFVLVTPHRETVENYLAKLKVEPASKLSTLLNISLIEQIPDKGESILNQLIREYKEESVVDKTKEALTTLNFIEDRLSLISGQLSTVEKEVESYKSTQGVTDLSIQAQSFLTTVKENDSKLNEVDIQLSALVDIEKYVQNHSEQNSVAPAVLGIDDPILTGLLIRVSDLELKREEISRTVSSDNPMLQSIESQLKTTKISINENISTIRQQLTSRRNQLLSNNRNTEGLIRTIPGKERALLNMTRQQVIKNGLYNYLLQKREETALSAASVASQSRTVDSAHAGSKPMQSNNLVIYGIFAVLGLVFPIGFITAKDKLNNHVLRRADVEEATQIPIIAEVVRDRHIQDENIINNPRSQSVFGEQIRALRTNVNFLRNENNKAQVLLFTSSNSGEGKSFISLNLGASLALAGRKTVILEMDLRRPKLHKSLQIPNETGLSDYLNEISTIDTILNPVSNHNGYFIITAGSLANNPSELLSSERLLVLFQELRTKFDYILIDSPPIGLVTDAQLIAPFADATIFLVRHDHTSKKFIKTVDNLFKENKLPNLNIILNGVGKSESSNYSYNYKDYKNLVKNSA